MFTGLYPIISVIKKTIHTIRCNFDFYSTLSEQRHEAKAQAVIISFYQSK